MNEPQLYDLNSNIDSPLLFHFKLISMRYLPAGHRHLTTSRLSVAQLLDFKTSLEGSWQR